MKARLKRWLGITRLEWAIDAQGKNLAKDIAILARTVDSLEDRIEELEQQRPINSTEIAKRLNITEVKGDSKPWKRAK